MSSAGEKQVKRAMFEYLRSPLSGEGFTLKATKDSFIRGKDGAADIFQLVCLEGKPGWRVQPNVARRVDRVEEIFHQTSGFELKFQQDTPTIGGSVGSITGGDNRTCEVRIESDADLGPATEKILRVFREFALPYFEKFSSLFAIDAALNDRPTERTPHRVAPWLRCATSVIIAKLVARPNYQQLVDIYTDVMRHSDKGFYLDRFQMLVNSLNSIEAGSGLAR